MLLIIVGLAVGLPIVWVLSVGALREVRDARRDDPRAGCQAWVRVRGLPGRRYRCAQPLYAGGTWCLPHEVGVRDTAPTADDAITVDEPQTVGRALVQARIGVPLALVVVLGLVAAGVWTVRWFT